MVGYIITFLLIVIVSFLCFNKNEKAAILILVFTICMNLFNPLARFNQYLDFEINGLAVWIIWFFRLSINRKYNIRSRKINMTFNFLYFFLFYGVLLGYINYGYIEKLDTATFGLYEIPVWGQIFSVSLWIITTVLFIKILLPYRDDRKFQTILLTVFISTIFMHLLATGFQVFLGLRSSSVINSMIIHDTFKGLFYDGELIIDYVMMVIAFSLLTIKNHQIFSIITTLTAFYVGLLSASRSFIVVSFIFFGVLTTLMVFKSNYFRKSKVRLVILGICMVGVVSYLSVPSFWENLNIIKRINESQYLFIQKDYESAFDRNYKSIPVIFERISLLGAGAGYFWEIDNHYMVCHNVILAMYAKYGILGVAAILYLFAIALKSLYLILRNKTESISKVEAAILFSLIIALFFQQQKVSFIREITPILFYTFLFIIVYFEYYNFIKTKTTTKYARRNHNKTN